MRSGGRRKGTKEDVGAGRRGGGEGGREGGRGKEGGGGGRGGEEEGKGKREGEGGGGGREEEERGGGGDWKLLDRQFRQAGAPCRLTISLVTFGYRFGVPYDIDLLFDVRFLRNPVSIPELKPLTGEDPRVRTYVLAYRDAVAFIGQLEGLFKFLIPLFD